MYQYDRIMPECLAFFYRRDFGLCGCLDGMVHWCRTDSLKDMEQYIEELSEKGTPIYLANLSLREADALALSAHQIRVNQPVSNILSKPSLRGENGSSSSPLKVNTRN